MNQEELRKKWEEQRPIREKTNQYFEISKAYVMRNYGTLVKVYGKDEVLAMNGEVVLDHDKEVIPLAVRVRKRFPQQDFPVLVQRLEDFINPRVHEMASPEVVEIIPSIQRGLPEDPELYGG